MIKELNGTRSELFRWHDSGDLVSLDYTKKVFEIIKATPQVLHRLPTREVKFIEEMLPLPENARVQISANFLDKFPLRVPEGCTSSIVFTDKPPKDVFVCPATTIRHKCLDCRACWNKEVKCVAYKKH